jgi:hypothetical protein
MVGYQKIILNYIGSIHLKIKIFEYLGMKFDNTPLQNLILPFILIFLI